MAHKNPFCTPRFIKLEATANQTGMGKSTVLAWEATGRFPPAVRLSTTLRVWLQEDVDNWILEQHAKVKGSTNKEKGLSVAQKFEQIPSSQEVV